MKDKKEQEEYLLRAMSDVSDDLLHMAVYRKFPNQWRRWGSLAACIALVLCLGLVALPYFPMGCGSSQKAEDAAPESAENMAEAEAPAEIPMPETEEERPVEEDEKAEAAEPESTDSAALPLQSRNRLTFRFTYYYEQPGVVLPGQTPGNLGYPYGEVEDSEDESLIGCPVYAVAYSPEYANHAVQGLAVPAEIYVETPEGYVLYRTANEKTVSRATAGEVQDAIHRGDDRWLLQTFLEPMERCGASDFRNGANLTGDQLNTLFLGTLDLNTTFRVFETSILDNGLLVIHPDDVKLRLDRFLDSFVYDGTATEAWNPETGMLELNAVCLDEPVLDELTLEDAALESGLLTLRVRRADDLVRTYVIRLDEDSWRYEQIFTEK